MTDVPHPATASFPVRNEQAVTDVDLAAMAEVLRASGGYRVQRRLKPRRTINPIDGSTTRTALLVDVETTGLDPYKDEIIELAMVPFTYGVDGRIFEIGKPFERFQEPTSPIPTNITQLTGITDAMVAGQHIDPAEVSTFASGAALVVAHNAAFDRRFVERLSEVFATKPWACSMTQIDWVGEGHEGTKLTYLAAGAGFFYERHRAVHDCHAAIELLAATLPISGVPAMSQLLDRARRSSWRIWAENSPFDLKDTLKARGYRWNGESNSGPRAWYIDVDDQDRETELAYLRNEIYKHEIKLLENKITAYNRFSDRL